MTNITVLVAVYNAEDYLEQCLDSLLGQSLRDIQVVCIDDASTDRSPDILRRYAQADGRVCLLRMEENSGQAVARNRGLEMATGELTTMVDADDYLAPDALEQLWRAYRANPSADAAVFRLVRAASVWTGACTDITPSAPTFIAAIPIMRNAASIPTTSLRASTTCTVAKWP